MKIECEMCKERFQEGDHELMMEHLMKEHPEVASEALEDVIDDYFVWARKAKGGE